MPTQQFDIFDLVVNVVPGLTAIILAVPYYPSRLLGFQYLELGIVGAGIGVVVLVLSYLLGEFVYGLARQRRVLSLYDWFESVLDWFPLINGLTTHPEYNQTFQDYVTLSLQNGEAPSLNKASVTQTLTLAENYYGLDFLKEAEGEKGEVENLGQLYYLTRSELAGKDAVSLRFETEANLFLTLWFVFVIDVVAHVVMITGYAIFPNANYTTIWHQFVGTTVLANVLYVGLLIGCVAFCVLRRHKYREKQVKTMIYDLYVHLNSQL